jgi:hypothetical protein
MARRKTALINRGANFGNFITVDQPKLSFPGETTLATMSITELIEAGILPRIAPPAGQRVVPSGSLMIDTQLGGVLVEQEGAVTPSGGELTVTEVPMDGRSTRTTDGVVTLRRLSGTIVLDGMDDGRDQMPILNQLQDIARLGLPCRLYGVLPWKHLPWRLETAPKWNGKEAWIGNTLVQATGDVSFVEHNPVELLEIKPGKPGSAAAAARKKARQAFIADGSSMGTLPSQTFLPDPIGG